jgi:flagellar motor switch protein FliN/FliY
MPGQFAEGEAVEVSGIQFPTLEKGLSAKKFNNEVFSNIPVEVTVELGRTKISLKDLYELSEGSIIELERLAGEPLDLVVNGQTVAQGEVVAIDENYGLRITHIVAR